MTIEQDMISEIESIKSKINDLEADLENKQTELATLRKGLSNKIKAKALFFGEKLPKPKKKKVEEIKKDE